MSKIIKIYCEGKKGSHDFDLLQHVINGVEGETLVKPIGGKGGAKRAVQVHEQLAVKSKFYLLFRDRDFDAPIPNIAELTKNGSYTYYCHRITIENYLWSPKMVFNFLNEKDLIAKYRLENEEAVRQLFIQAAKNILYYQAVRHTLGKLRFATDFGTSWLSKSGKLPEDLSLKYCQQKAWEQIERVKSKTDKDWTKENYEKILQEFLEIFDGDFFNRLDFLIWFQGKDFAKSITQSLSSDFRLKDYYKFAKKYFDYTEFPDLVELRGIITNCEHKSTSSTT